MSREQRRPTPIDLGEMAHTLGQAWRAQHGRNPTPTEGLSMMTLLAIENGLGASIVNHNWGNISTTPNDDRGYWLPPWMDDDYIIAHPEQQQQMFHLRSEANAGRQPKAFRAFASHLAGAGAFVELLGKETHQRITQATNANQLWRAVSTPHPVTKKSWCAGCDNEATRKGYERMWAQLSPSFIPAGQSVAKKKGGNGLAVLASVVLIFAPLGAFFIKRKKR